MAIERHRKSDAALILAVIGATAEWQDATSLAAVVKPLRELIWAVWEQPRLPKPLIRGKYPASVPWSPAARHAIGEDPRALLVLEHVTPASVIVKDLVRRPPANEAALVRTLRRRIEHVVITPADNRQLNRAGVGWTLPPGSKNPWDRYVIAGLPVRDFRPLDGSDH